MAKSKKTKNKKDVAAFEELARKVADTAAGRKKSKDRSEEELAAEAEESVSALVEDALEAGAALFAESGDDIKEPVGERDEAIAEAQVEVEAQEIDTPRKKSKKKKGTKATAETQAETEPESQIEAAAEETEVVADESETPAENSEEGFENVESAEGEAISFEASDETAQETTEGDVDDGFTADEPSEDDERTYEFFVENDRLISVIESLLFSTDKPVSVASIRGLFRGSNVRTSKQIQKALDTLASRYADPMSGVTLEEIGGGYQLRTKVDNAEYLKKIIKVRPFKLSGPALETMSIIAYKQPIPKTEIDQIRGVESGHLLRALMERGLVAFEGKSETLPGKPMLYGSTKKFLEIFGLRNIKELPSVAEVEELLPDGIGQEEKPKEKLADITGDLSTEVGSKYSEGEDELLDIANELTSINTKSEFFEQEKQRQREQRDRERAQDIRERVLVGEAVEERDKRWLARYEAAQLAPVEGPGAAVEGGTEGGLDVEAVADPISETAVADLELQADLDTSDEENLEHDSSEDVAAHPEYKDDREPEAGV